ncbi:carbapenem antibiotics biosynthesis protein card [Sporormia fimetaria CBS 119925]|uniref:Proline dehydrogenase n=1 Tax=Sporormia fimetaria CBS 119925 TaxID=1340428 RepID=A0A6A6V1U5_9PLEO|nr:carbapenem antibiotics biosynthesis protein card [Sporormia fimetaria CBS 119925]
MHPAPTSLMQPTQLNLQQQQPLIPSSPSSSHAPPPALSRLPTTSILRTYLITTLSSSPTLLNAIYTTLLKLLDSKSAFLSLERNPLLNWILKSTFYAQFCAGETPAEIRANTALARSELGYDGIILEYAVEVLSAEGKQTEAEIQRDVESWKKGMLDTISLARDGDFVGLKWSGLGPHALTLLQSYLPPTPLITSALHTVCTAAAAKHISLLPGAEESATNPGLEAWTLDLQRKYNTRERGYAVVYTTYQCYFRNAPERVAMLLHAAKKDGFIAGVKLVRGAYLGSEGREKVWGSKEETDRCYDECAEAVIRGRWTQGIQAPEGEKGQVGFPDRDIILATHNRTSLLRGVELRRELQLSTPSATSSTNPAPARTPRITYAQLQGMADEISQELVTHPDVKLDTQARVVKLFAFGTLRECMNFLVRRAVENKEAGMRTEETRKAMGVELRRRVRGLIGM